MAALEIACDLVYPKGFSPQEGALYLAYLSYSTFVKEHDMREGHLKERIRFAEEDWINAGRVNPKNVEAWQPPRSVRQGHRSANPRNCEAGKASLNFGYDGFPTAAPRLRHWPCALATGVALIVTRILGPQSTRLPLLSVPRRRPPNPSSTAVVKTNGSCDFTYRGTKLPIPPSKETVAANPHG